MNLQLGKKWPWYHKKHMLLSWQTVSGQNLAFDKKNMDVSGHAGYNCKTMLFSTMCKHHVFEKNGYASGKLTLSLPNVLSRKSGQLKKNVPNINSHPHQSDLWT